MSKALRTRFAGKSRRLWWIAIAAAVLIGFFVWRTPRPKPVYYASASLEPGTLRSSGGGIQWVDLPPEATAAQIELRNTPGEAAQASLRQVDSGQVIWRGTVAQGTAIIPAASLAPGDFVLTVADARGEELADYSFRVRRGP